LTRSPHPGRKWIIPHFAKPAEGSWTEHYPGLGTGPVDYSDSIDPAHYEAGREAIFKRTWLNVGRVERLPKTGSYFTRELTAAGTSVIAVRGKDGQIRAFHNICRHRGNKLVWGSGI
jgi:phenylpropionate dioxygenase-like ring-hydroxylating dioxygenase large terminal subunit